MWGRVTCGVERRLLHLDLLVQPAELVVPLDQLGAEHVAFGQNSLVLLLLLQPLGVGLVDDHVQREHLRLETRLLGLALADALLDVGELIPQHLLLLVDLHVLEVLLDETLVLCLDLLLQLLDLPRVVIVG